MSFTAEYSHAHILLISYFHLKFYAVLAISCFKCTPDIPKTTCVSGDIKITNCDTDPDIPQGRKADACYKMSFVMINGTAKFTVNAMGCVTKVSFDHMYFENISSILNYQLLRNRLFEQEGHDIDIMD